MSNPYGPAIETTEDWNEALACCCQMPTAPGVIKECQSVSVDACGFELPAHEDLAEGEECLRFKTRTDTLGFTSNYIDDNPINGLYYDDEVTENRSQTLTKENGPTGCVERLTAATHTLTAHSIIREGDSSGDLVRDQDTTMSASLNVTTGLLTGTSTVTDNLDSENNSSESVELSPLGELDVTGFNYTSPGNYSFSTTTDLDDLPQYSGEEVTTQQVLFADPVTAETLAAELEEAIADLGSGSWPGTECKSALSGTSGCPKSPFRITQGRFRFRVPSSHTGDYYKVTWDELYEPLGWDDEAIPEEDRPIRYSRKNKTAEWTGPGTGAQSDPSWLIGGWRTLPVPTEPGEWRVINVRFEHIRKEGA